MDPIELNDVRLSDKEVDDVVRKGGSVRTAQVLKVVRVVMERNRVTGTSLARWGRESGHCGSGVRAGHRRPAADGGEKIVDGMMEP